MANKCFIKRNGQWERLSPMKKVNGQWVRCPVYKKENGVWNRIDQQLVTKTYSISGYSDWTCCYIGSSSTDSTLSKKGTDPLPPRQGKYSTYYYFSPMSFKSLLSRVKGKNIVSARVWMKCDHSYYSTGLKTYISGTTISNTSIPSNINNSVFNNKRYSSDVHFSKGGSNYINLNSAAISDIKAGNITGFRPVACGGFKLTDYGYFNESGTTRPWLEIVYTEQVWE